MKGQRFLLALLCASALGGTSCLVLPEFVGPVPFFEGCYTGPVTSFMNPPTVTIVLQAVPNDMTKMGVTGCFVLSGSVVRSVTLSGMVDSEDVTRANLTATQTGNGMMQDFVAVREPASGNAETLTLANTMGFIAPSLQRCTQTCIGLGVVVP